MFGKKQKKQSKSWNVCLFFLNVNTFWQENLNVVSFYMQMKECSFYHTHECQERKKTCWCHKWSFFNIVQSTSLYLILLRWWGCACVWVSVRRKTTSMYLLHFVIWVCFFSCFFFLSFSLLPLSRQESRKAVNWILRHCTVDQSCKYFTSTKKKKTNKNTVCFVVSQQIKPYPLFLWSGCCLFSAPSCEF